MKRKEERREEKRIKGRENNRKGKISYDKKRRVQRRKRIKKK